MSMSTRWTYTPTVRYVVDIKSARAPATFWGWARVVRVLDTTTAKHAPGSGLSWVRRATVKQWGDQYSGRGTQHLDGKYTGPRSAYGKALREAAELAAKLNAEEVGGGGGGGGGGGVSVRD
jgi:hypothetical protein